MAFFHFVMKRNVGFSVCIFYRCPVLVVSRFGGKRRQPAPTAGNLCITGTGNHVPAGGADIKFQAPEIAGIECVRFQIPVQNFFNIDLKQVEKFPEQAYVGTTQTALPFGDRFIAEIHVRVLWDEAANTGQVPQLEKLVAVIRSREVSLCLLYQQLAQCKAIYDKNAETILGNMDSVVFLGGRESSTIKEISENWLGKATISMWRSM